MWRPFVIMGRMTLRQGITIGLVAAVAGVPVAEAGAVKPRKNARFQGATKQKKQIRFNTSKSGRHVLKVKFQYRMRCTNGRRASVASISKSLTVKDSKFTFGKRRGVLRVWGRFTSRTRVKGWFRIRFSSAQEKCDTKTVSWTARVV